ncbi:MAG: hypothetical protein JWP35_4553 [Caulobacter sp.]|nr:hypothetical protein [Caulobacter sp.]
MTIEAKDIAGAEKGAHRRTRALMFSAALFLIWQGVFYKWGVPDSAPLNGPDRLKVAAWAVWALMLLVVLATGGGLLQSAKVRALMNDEVARHNRHSGLHYGFWGAMLAAFALYGLSFFTVLSVHQTIHALLTVSIGLALLRYAWLERRSERGE